MKRSISTYIFPPFSKISVYPMEVCERSLVIHLSVKFSPFHIHWIIRIRVRELDPIVGVLSQNSLRKNVFRLFDRIVLMTTNIMFGELRPYLSKFKRWHVFHADSLLSSFELQNQSMCWQYSKFNRKFNRCWRKNYRSCVHRTPLSR